MDHSFMEEQAALCRKLADSADQFTKRRLLKLAANYEDRLLGRPSRATRSISGHVTSWSSGEGEGK